jgi:hypothetical protein
MSESSKRTNLSAYIALFTVQFIIAATSSKAIGKTYYPPSNITTSASLSSAIPDREFASQLKKNPLKSLKLMTQHFDNAIIDYTGSFCKQERVDGTLLNPQTIDFKFRQKPFSLFMKWPASNNPVDRLLYVKGANNGKMIVHPTGLLSWVKSVEADLNDEQATKTNLRTCEQFGIRNMLVEMEKAYSQASAGNFNIKHLGDTTINQRPCAKLKINIPQGTFQSTEEVILTVDLGYRLPTAVTCLDRNGNLTSSYSYTNLDFNTNLTDQNFTKTANKL